MDSAGNYSGAYGISPGGRYVVGTSDEDDGLGGTTPYPFLYDTTTGTLYDSNTSPGSLSAVDDAGTGVGTATVDGTSEAVDVVPGTAGLTALADQTGNVGSYTLDSASAISNDGLIVGSATPGRRPARVRADARHGRADDHGPPAGDDHVGRHAVPDAVLGRRDRRGRRQRSSPCCSARRSSPARRPWP